MKIVLTACMVVCACMSVNAGTRPDSHAPIGIMGDHYHKTGEIMLSYRFMHMSMAGNRNNTFDLTPEQIVTTATNLFAVAPMMPPTLRVVPTKMTMDMHMLGVMYAPNDRLTLMGMVNHIKKDMTHITFAGPVGTTRLGSFETKTSGIGDISVSGLIKLQETSQSRWHLTLGLSLPTGSTDETGAILTPMNQRPSIRLPYPMQLGSGTYDLISGLTYAGHRHRWGWGVQWRSVVHLQDNDENYSLGNEHGLHSWLSYRISQWVSTSLRLTYEEKGNVDGMDKLIMAPVQTADPNRQGGQRVNFSIGANVVLPGERMRIAMEIHAPLQQDLSGPQLETDWYATLGIQLIPSVHGAN